MVDLLQRPWGQRLLAGSLWLVGLGLYFSAPLSNGLPTQTVSLIGCAFVAMTFFWDSRSRPSRETWVVAALMLCSGVVASVALSGASWLDSLQVVSGNIVGGAIGTVCWGALRGTAQAPPRNVWTLLGFLATTVVASAAGGIAGAWRGEGYLAVLGPADTMWILRSAVFSLVVGLVFLPLRFGDVDRWRTAPPPSQFIKLGALPITVVCFAIAYLGSSLPLAWVILIPSLWVGLNATPLWASTHVLVMAAVAAGMRQLPFEPLGIEGILPPSFVLDALLVEAILMVMLLALLRDERDQAVQAETGHKQTYDTEAELLAQVFDSMADGVIIYDTTTGESTSNPAAKAILGRTRPPVDLTPHEGWSRYFGLSNLDGSPLQDADLQLAMQSGPVSLVRLDRPEGTRIVALRTTTVRKTSIAILLTDVTEQHAHLADLERFAHTVAHDLRSPLSNLTGWVEMALEEAIEQPDDDDGKTEALLIDALISGDQMRQVIERWLDQALAKQDR